MACETPFRDDSEQRLLFKIASCIQSGGGVAGVASFNGRTGVVTLTAGDVATVADDLYVNETGDSMTGALSIDNGVLAANDPALELSQTWNNAAVDFKAFTLNVTNTAAGSGSMLLDVQQDAITRFTIFENGSLVRFISQEQTDTGLGLFLRKRGTAVDSTAAIASGGGLATIFFSGWNGAAYVQAASIKTFAEELFTGVANGSRMEFHTTPIGSATPVVNLLLSSTGQAQLRDGTAALPSLSFQSDTNTGIYRIGADSFGSSAGGSVILATSTTGINLTTALAYQYNSVNVIRAQTALVNYFFGPSGNLTMTGVSNLSVGSQTLASNTTGGNNSGFGDSVLFSNTTGSNNSAFGVNALLFNVVGGSNTAMGVGALFSNVASNNSAFGFEALNLNTSGTTNAAFGFKALRSNTTGSNNSAFGMDSLIANTTGGSNSGYGFSTLAANTTGGGNCALGGQALLVNTIGDDNAAFGAGALIANTTGINNCALGTLSLGNVTTGSNNSSIGYNTGLGITTGSNNTIIGANVAGLAAALSNNIILADGAGVIRLQIDSSGNTSLAGNLSLATAKTLSMASGANQRAGNLTLIGGTLTVANTSVTANTIVLLTRKTAGGTIGTAISYTVIAATSFTVTSDSALDTSTFSYMLVEVP